MFPTSSLTPGVEVEYTLQDLAPLVFCLYGVQLQYICSSLARRQLLPAVRTAVLLPTTKITAEEAFICLLNSFLSRKYDNRNHLKHYLMQL